MEKNFDFYGSMPHDVLLSYLSRAVSHCELNRSGTFEDDLRMLKREGAKLIGRAFQFWAGAGEIGAYFSLCRERAARAHAVDPQFILQGCVFECIKRGTVESIPVPAYVFRAFGLSAEDRNFRYDDMLFPDGKYVDFWGADCSVEDITRLETRLWVYYLATSYIEVGCEGLHFGQVCLMGENDVGYNCWREVLGKVREYTAAHARRKYVLFDAHQVGALRQDPDLFDYNAFPIRLKEVPEIRYECICAENYLDSMFNAVDGFCKPFMVEFDNYGKLPDCGNPHENSYFAWGYDEITWFTRLDAARRTAFLHYIHGWVRERYPEGFVQMPSRRCLVEPAETVWESPDTAWLDAVKKREALDYTLDDRGAAHISRMFYSANRKGNGCPFGFGDEDAITEIFGKEEDK